MLHRPTAHQLLQLLQEDLNRICGDARPDAPLAVGEPLQEPVQLEDFERSLERWKEVIHVHQAPGLRLRVAFQGFHHLQATRFPGKVQGGPVGGSAYPTTKKHISLSKLHSCHHHLAATDLQPAQETITGQQFEIADQHLS